MSDQLFQDVNIQTINQDTVLAEGSIIHDRFLLIKPLGTGGMGTVFKAIDKRREEANVANPYIAIKFINDKFKHHPQAFLALQHEAMRAQELSHPNIVNIYDFDRSQSLAYITMEYLQGQTLKQLMQNNTLDFSQKWQLIKQIANALNYAHQQGYIHADLKPSNIFITEHQQVKLIDFGLANITEQNQTDFQPEQLFAHSPKYASNSVLKGHKPTAQDDIYSFASICYECLTGEPWKRNEITEITLPNLSDTQNLWLTGAMTESVHKLNILDFIQTSFQMAAGSHQKPWWWLAAGACIGALLAVVVNIYLLH